MEKQTMRNGSKSKDKIFQIPTHSKRNNPVVKLEKLNMNVIKKYSKIKLLNETKNLVIKLQKLDLNTIKYVSNKDPAEKFFPKQLGNNLVQTSKKMKEVEEIKNNPRRKKTSRKKKEIIPTRECPHSESKELKSSFIFERYNPIVRLKRLDMKTIEKYTKMSLLSKTTTPIVKLQKLDMSTIRQYSKTDSAEKTPSNVPYSNISKSGTCLKKIKETNPEMKKTVQKKKEMDSKCDYTLNNERLLRSSRFRRNNPTVKLKKLDTKTTEYSNTDSLKKNLKPIIKVQKLDLNSITRFSNFDLIKEKSPKLAESNNMAAAPKRKTNQPTVRSKRIKRNKESVSKKSAADLQYETIIPPNPCKNGCDRICELISEERRYKLNTYFWSLNSSNERAAFLNDIIRYRWDEEEEFVVCYYLININGANQRVCLKFLLATLNIEIEVVMQHISKLVEMDDKSKFFQQAVNYKADS